MFRCGENDAGRSLKLSLDEFVSYMQSQRDDSPLYVFDDTYGDREATRELLEDYSVPEYFPEDLLGLLTEEERPPYRWFLLGPKRSGSGLHQDPLSTSAWNACIQGYKLWAMFPPNMSCLLYTSPSPRDS